MKFTNYLTIISALTLASGCTLGVKYKPDNEQKTFRADLATKEAPPNKSVIEFTTNAFIPATLTQQTGPDLCNPEKKFAISRVQRQRELTTAEKSAKGIGNFLTFGLADKLLPTEFNSGSISEFFYIDAGEEIALQASSYMSEKTASGFQTTSCGPIYMKLTPEDGGRYKIFFNTKSDGCDVMLTKSENSLTSIPKHTRWSCTKPFAGIGSSKIIGLREIPASSQPKTN